MSQSGHQFTFSCDDSLTGQRLDQALLQLLELASGESRSRSQIQRIIEAGGVTFNGKPEMRPGCRVKAGDALELIIPEVQEQRIIAQEMPLTILFEDEHLLCLNKPPGLTVHPGAGQRDGTLLNALAHYLQQVPELIPGSRPWIVHRIDKDTSGILIIAKNDRAHRALSQQFHDRVVEKEYQALVLATPRMRNPYLIPDQGVIDLPIGRHQSQRTRMAVDPQSGRSAITRWSVIERFEYGALLRLQIETGRTHQIRLHLEAIGAPVIGDRTYGNFQALPKSLALLHQQFGRQALHAHRLSCLHPETGEKISFEAPIPADMTDLIAAWRG